MIKVKSEYDVDKYKVLVLSDNVPLVSFKEVQIEGERYVPEIVYDAKNEIGIISKKSFVGKEIKFIM